MEKNPLCWDCGKRRMRYAEKTRLRQCPDPSCKALLWSVFTKAPGNSGEKCPRCRQRAFKKLGAVGSIGIFRCNICGTSAAKLQR